MRKVEFTNSRVIQNAWIMKCLLLFSQHLPLSTSPAPKVAQSPHTYDNASYSLPELYTDCRLCFKELYAQYRPKNATFDQSLTDWSFHS